MFLPASKPEMLARNWDQADIILVTGDAYVDHPAFGVALIGRLLEAQGYRVAILPQPRHDGPEAFRTFGRPRLFFGITAGNMDSIVANYSGNAKVRDHDDFSPGGNPYFGSTKSRLERRRPDRASIRYAQLARAAYPDVPIILGGIEASLRRFIHYDYQQAKIRASVLADAKADLLVFGMAEKAIVEVAARLDHGHSLAGIPGTCERLTDKEQAARVAGMAVEILPGWREINTDTGQFLTAETTLDAWSRTGSQKPVLQKQQAAWIWQNPAAPPLAPAELDRLYSLPFARAPHPGAGDVPAYRMIRHSVTIVRGCSGNCSFCAITRHQGPVVVSRSQASILAECRRLTEMPDFTGTITDLGGPTANLFGTSCSQANCRRHDCLQPRVCRHLVIDAAALSRLLADAASLPKVKNVFISSGLRMELLLRTPELLAQLLEKHTPGTMKIAPEHTEKEVLRLMHKGDRDLLPAFLNKAREIAAARGMPLHFTPYFIAAHPGCRPEDMARLAERLKNLGISVRQFQDFTPTPGTLATAMYVSGLDRDTRQPIFVARNNLERQAQRQVLEQFLPRSPAAPPGLKRKRRKART